MTNSTTNFLNYCAGCGKTIEHGIFCSERCETIAFAAYEIDMEELSLEPLSEVIERDLCPVCMDHPRKHGKPTCGHSECNELYNFAFGR